MKKLLLAFSLMLTMGLSAPSAKAYFYVDFPYGQFSETYALGGNNLLFAFFCWSNDCAYWDVFTTHSSGAANPISVSISGGPYGMSYFLEEDYYDAYNIYYNTYYTTNWGANWYYAGYYYIPY